MGEPRRDPSAAAAAVCGKCDLPRTGTFPPEGQAPADCGEINRYSYPAYRGGQWCGAGRTAYGAQGKYEHGHHHTQKRVELVNKSYRDPKKWHIENPVGPEGAGGGNPAQIASGMQRTQ